MSKADKLSFSFTLSSSKPKPKPKPPSSKSNPKSLHENEHEHEPQSQPQYVTEFDASKTLTLNPQIIVPPKENTFNLHTGTKKKMQNLDLSSLQSEKATLQFELENPSSAPDPTANISYGLTIRAKENGELKPSDSGPPSSLEEVSLQKLREGLNNLPDDRGFEEFKDIPVEAFGAAVLAGYGWSEGQGIGRNPKEDVQVPQYLRRANKEGLGFVPDLPDMKQKQKHGGGRRSDPPLVAPVGPDGRTRHVVGIDEKLVPRELRGVLVGKVVRVIDGRHSGLKGKVVEKSDSDSGSGSVVLKLLKSGEDVRVGLNQVGEVGSFEEVLFLRKLQESKSRGRDDRKNSASRGYREKRDDDKEDGSKDKKKRRVEEGGRDRRESQSSNRNGSSRREEVRSLASWLTSHIRVRIISKGFRGGKLYLKKGVVMDVVGPTTCDISMDENKELIQGVDQEILETAIPKSGGPVLVLYGKHKGVFGNLVESDKERETGVVRDADTHALLNVRLEQIAEYIGDPSYLGY
eukprot:TRINITY_DN1898_c1_g1_i2.p1 TRINITY_DN1898_c1_g1~~TRINITY_DN1898_c1_g1_i2.p1  ORF type:complete len:519 (-),score=115.57 TRINITY_DN1898_c1_g1_i2:397-1953(-)